MMSQFGFPRSPLESWHKDSSTKSRQPGEVGSGESTGGGAGRTIREGRMLRVVKFSGRLPQQGNETQPCIDPGACENTCLRVLPRGTGAGVFRHQLSPGTSAAIPTKPSITHYMDSLVLKALHLIFTHFSDYDNFLHVWMAGSHCLTNNHRQITCGRDFTDPTSPHKHGQFISDLTAIPLTSNLENIQYTPAYN